MGKKFIVKCPHCGADEALILFVKKGDTAALKCSNCGVKPMPITLRQVKERFPDAREVIE